MHIYICSILAQFILAQGLLFGFRPSICWLPIGLPKAAGWLANHCQLDRQALPVGFAKGCQLGLSPTFGFRHSPLFGFDARQPKPLFDVASQVTMRNQAGGLSDSSVHTVSK